ncbi:L-asparaginase II [Plenodomus tracheiphilus IPT5]|uniref:L-asparaginase II n=1 Tax=Plenodomus tracheiphilus IPT5 TaxID=1408161 RepID=A0A6A7B6S3_9PLEO|nr:L-asparaginase II [Plenodomus tracheiphilus IPT5]
MPATSPPNASTTHQTPNNEHENNTIVSLRGPCLENTHFIHIAIVTPTGTPLYTTGTPNRTTLLRSALKPIQALAILSTGASTKYSLTDADIALLCASHSSEPHHISRARSILARTGVHESVLTCGGHAAINPAVNREWVKCDFTPTGIHSNCSGKHAGMIAGALALGERAEGYQELEHPMQKRVGRLTEEMSACKPEEVAWAVDGCNLPAPALPLVGLARMFAGLAGARDGIGEGAGEEGGDEMNGQLSRIFDAMATYPELVGGQGRFCTEMMTAFRGLLVGKVGADGCYGIGIRASSLENGHGHGHGAMGIAVKIEDGNLDILYAAIPEILEQLGIGTPEMRRQLDGWRFPVMKNTAGVVIGRLEHRFKIRKVGESNDD